MSRKGQAKTLTEQEFKIVEAVILTKTNAKRNRAILYMAFGLGLRACEIRGLTLKDVLQDDMITIKTDVKLKRTKGDEPRWVFVGNKKIRDVLQDHLKDMKFYLSRKNIPISPDLPLFISQKGGFFRSDKMVWLFAKFFKNAGIHDAKSHSGRVTYITNRINKGIDLASISSLVGHSSIEMTMHYYRKDANRLRKISEMDIF